jgi:hypothetical protein
VRGAAIAIDGHATANINPKVLIKFFIIICYICKYAYLTFALILIVPLFHGLNGQSKCHVIVFHSLVSGFGFELINSISSFGRMSVIV